MSSEENKPKQGAVPEGLLGSKQGEDVEEQKTGYQNLEEKQVTKPGFWGTTVLPPDRIVDSSGVKYKLNEVPPLAESLLLGFQHFMIMLGATVLIPQLLVPAMGGSDKDLAQTINTIFFVSGLNTLIQTFLGDRLPIIQGGSFSFLTPTFAIIGRVAANYQGDPADQFETTMREIQGGIIGASFFQLFIGYSGLMSYMLRFISPIVIAPTVALVGLALFGAGFPSVGGCMSLGLMQIATVILFSQYLKRVPFWIPGIGRYRIFELFPVILGIAVTWIFGVILTEAGTFSTNSECRTDQTNILDEAPWFRFPYPFQYGAPTFSASSVFAILAGSLASMIESVGDYYACARLSEAPVPPPYVISRGIGAEGIGCLLAGFWGTANGTTSYSENIGAISITGVGSRRVVQVAAVYMLVLGCVGKFGALFASMPYPMVAGLFCVMFGIIAAVGISNLQYADMNSSRNLFIVGFALYNGLSVQAYFNQYNDTNGHFPIDTKSTEFNDIFNTLFSTPMVVALLASFILDNTIPGTREERGLNAWTLKKVDRDDPEIRNAYDIPFLSKHIERPILGTVDRFWARFNKN
eukprot:TRINITY_DN22064_c1_g1_i4.p1 TRINITY_DN22064_c1_g1~~TRINITY_DN22064_c1_g1_i4.p1  ORF type:complete len:580 (+),score=98.25 TRINITY_DN22064_c1_g1_i4:77-1816(+)